MVLAGGSIEDKHTAGATNLRWGLGDQLFRQVEMEVGYEQSMSILVVNIVVLCVVSVVSLWCLAWVVLPFEKCATFSNYFFWDAANSTTRSSADWTSGKSPGTLRDQATVTREKGLGMRKRSQERSCQARSGWA